MATKFLVLEEAAARLGITAEELNDRRSRAEINGYRDGKSWKFREADIDQFATRLAAGGTEDPGLVDDLDLGLDDDLDLTGVKSPASKPSAPVADSGPDDFDLDLALDDDLPPAVSAAPASKVKPSDELPMRLDDELTLKLDDDLDVTMPGPPVTQGKPAPSFSDLDIKLGDEEEIDLAPVGSGTFDPAVVSPMLDPLPDDDGLELSLDDDDLSVAPAGMRGKSTESGSSDDFDLKLDQEASEEIGLGDDFDLAAPGEEKIELAAPASSKAKPSVPAPAASMDDDDALVLDDLPEGPTLASGDSGVSLLDDSGGADLVLDDPPAAADALSDDLNENEMLVSSNAADVDPNDSDFQLTPFDDIDADLSDSGSQVIQLESADDLSPGGGDSVNFEAAAADNAEFTPDDGGDLGGVMPGAAAAVAGGAAGALATGGAAVAMLPDTRFDGLDIGLLCTGAGLLTLMGFMMIDIVRNLGTWGSSNGVSSALLDSLAGLMGLK